MTSGHAVLYYAKSGQVKQYKTALRGIWELADEFSNSYGMEVGLEQSILIDVIRLYARDIDKMALDKVEPNAYRQAAALCIWLARLKPIVLVGCFDKIQASETRIQKVKAEINEIFAIFAAISVLRADKDDAGQQPGLVDLVKGLWTPALDDLLTVLRYRVVSRHAIAILLQTICEKGLKQPDFLAKAGGKL